MKKLIMAFCLGVAAPFFVGASINQIATQGLSRSELKGIGTTYFRQAVHDERTMAQAIFIRRAGDGVSIDAHARLARLQAEIFFHIERREEP